MTIFARKCRRTSDRATSERVARGMSADEAQREARREFGNVAHAREVTREQWGWIWLEQLGQDVRYAFRSLRKNPGFTAVAVLSLGLGIGANTAIFSLMDAVVLRSLPVRHPEQLVAVTNGIGAVDIAHFSNPGWEQLRDHPGLFNGSLAYSGVQFPLTQGGESRDGPGHSGQRQFLRRPWRARRGRTSAATYRRRARLRRSRRGKCGIRRARVR